MIEEKKIVVEPVPATACATTVVVPAPQVKPIDPTEVKPAPDKPATVVAVAVVEKK